MEHLEEMTLLSISIFNECSCACSSRIPPVSETVWKGLLQDLLDMQQNVYACLKPETCHQVLHSS